VYSGLWASTTLSEINDADPKKGDKIYKTAQDFYIEAME
jgi:hypothetical protein